MLQAAGTGLTSGELRAKLGGSPSTMYRAVTELIKAGKVRSEGKPARYSWIPGRNTTSPATTTTRRPVCHPRASEDVRPWSPPARSRAAPIMTPRS
ncbi:hypothetical protein [Nannocystis pusilla]|uniref:hypothetical protein n=1 Tax=Nannocystis pusilla TaxID=889268 RepID=UPI003B7BB52C